VAASAASGGLASGFFCAGGDYTKAQSIDKKILPAKIMRELLLAIWSSPGQSDLLLIP